MKKVGIITLYYKNFNYGGLLQAYALQYVIEKLGYDVEQIAYDYIYKKGGMNTVLRSIVHSARGIKKNPVVYLRCIHRRKNMFKFMEKIKHSQVVNVKKLENISNKYDILVTGSDQVWNTTWLKFDKAFFLDFGRKNNKIAYAVSMGQDFIPEEYKDEIAELLKSFTAISVRENSVREMLKEVTLKEVDIVLDPTLLLEKKEWDMICEKPEKKEKYIFVYLLGNKKIHREMVNNFAEKENLNIVTFSYLMIENSNDKNFGQVQDFKSSPQQFIGLISEAEYVITDSFHALVFSIIYRKKVFALKRYNDFNNMSMNARIENLVDSLNMRNILIEDGDSLSEKVNNCNLNYDDIENKISIYREQSLDFLTQALEQ